jgi:Domain of unknown function (DUF4169)
MAEVINLRVVRKSKLRIDKETVAVQNRAKFGRTKAVKSLEASQAKLSDDRLDGHKLTKDPA